MIAGRRATATSFQTLDSSRYSLAEEEGRTVKHPAPSDGRQTCGTVHGPSWQPGTPIGAAQQAAFDAAYRDMVGYVRRVVQRQAIQPADREDAVQDVFVVAYRRWNQLENGEGLRAWLQAIAVRICWNYRRAHRRWSLRFASHEGTEELPDPTGRVPDQLLSRKDELRWLAGAVGRLDEKMREALLLSRIECRSAAEISRLTGLSPNTVSSRLRAALRQLRQEVLAREVLVLESSSSRQGSHESGLSRTFLVDE
jgi:RNA polymerase sigma-70 factor (ECF subfamily)